MLNSESSVLFLVHSALYTLFLIMKSRGKIPVLAANPIYIMLAG